MTTLRGFVTASAAIVAGAVAVGVTTAVETHSTLLGLAAGGLFYAAAVVALFMAIVVRGIREDIRGRARD